MAAAATTTYSALKLEPFMNPGDARLFSVRLAPSTNFARGTVLGEITPTQVATINGTPTGGTFTLSYGGQTTTAIAYNATGATVQAALVLLSTIGTGNATVAGGAGGPYTVTITEPSAGLPAATLTALTANGAGLTGGASPTVTVAWGGAGITSYGFFKAYGSLNSDGSQTAKCILAYDVQTDASSNCTLSATASQVGGEWGQTKPYAPAYFNGVFKTEELVGLDAGGLTNLGGNLIQGTILSGVMQFGS